MKKILLVLLLISSVFAQTDSVIAVFKIGDQQSKKPFLDGELIEIIDLDEQVENFTLSDDMKRIFLCLPIHRREKGKFRSYTKPDAATKCILRPNRLRGPDKRQLRNKNAIKCFKNFDLNLLDIGVDLKPNPPQKDENAWEGGSVTVGSGGTYATWVVCGGDAGTFTSNGTATSISNTTESGTPTFDNAHGVYTMELGGGAFIMSYSGSNHGIRLDQEGTGDILVHSFHYLRTGNAASGVYAAIVIVNMSTTLDLFIFNNTSNGGSFIGSGIRIVDVTPILCVYNNVFLDHNGAASCSGFKTSGGTLNSASILENNTVYNCYLGFEMATNSGHLLNNAAFDNTVDYSSYSSLTTFSKCASSDSTGSESGLHNLIASEVFRSLDNLVPIEYGALDGTGVNPTIPGHTHYLNGIPIVLGNVDIGANGVVHRLLRPNKIYVNNLFNFSNYRFLNYK